MEPLFSIIIPAHNEQMLLETTIKSAITAGQPKEHIYVVDDESTDNTYNIATKILKGGDSMLQFSGGHGFEFQEDSRLLEVKQGPYVSHQLDKVLL